MTGDILFFGAGSQKVVNDSLGALITKIDIVILLKKTIFLRPVGSLVGN